MVLCTSSSIRIAVVAYVKNRLHLVMYAVLVGKTSDVSFSAPYKKIVAENLTLIYQNVGALQHYQRKQARAKKFYFFAAQIVTGHVDDSKIH